MATRLDMRLEFQQCRTWGHAWEDFIPEVGEKRPPQWGKRFSLRCVRCATERHDVFDSRGELSTRHYDYPDDYQYVGVEPEERPTLQQLRLSLVGELRRVHKARVNGNGNGHRKPPRRTRSYATVS